MKIFLHFQQQQVEKLVATLNKLHQLYEQQSYYFEKEFLLFCDAGIQYFESVGAQKLVLKFNELKTYFLTASKGISPITLERIRVEKRAMLQASSFYCLRELSLVFEQQLDLLNDKLEDAYQTLTQLILGMLQSGFIKREVLEKTRNPDQWAQFWQQIRADNTVYLIEKKLLAYITLEDLYILLDKVISNINNN